MLESDLSEVLMPYLKSLGYCVHGEVTKFNHFDKVVDHIAHTGPCDNPDHVVSFELKTSMNKKLLHQLIENEAYGVHDFSYAVTPEKRGYDTSHSIWSDMINRLTYPSVSRPGWLTIDSNGEIRVVVEPHIGKRGRRAHRKLLLVEENKDAVGGRALKKGDKIHTHYSLCRDYVRAKVEEYMGEDYFTKTALRQKPVPVPKELCDIVVANAPSHLFMHYEDVRDAVRRYIRTIHQEHQKMLIKLARKNRR